MAEPKTKSTGDSVAAFLAGVKEVRRRQDCEAVAALMAKATGKPPKMWGKSIVGFGDIRVQGASRTVDWFLVGFSPRKAALTLYLGMDLDPLKADLEKLGRHSRGLGCLYLKSLADVDLKVLKGMIAKTVKSLNAKYGAPDGR